MNRIQHIFGEPTGRGVPPRLGWAIGPPSSTPDGGVTHATNKRHRSVQPVRWSGLCGSVTHYQITRKDDLVQLPLNQRLSSGSAPDATRRLTAGVGSPTLFMISPKVKTVKRVCR